MDFAFLKIHFRNFANWFLIFGNAYSTYENTKSIFGNAFRIVENSFRLFGNAFQKTENPSAKLRWCIFCSNKMGYGIES